MNRGDRWLIVLPLVLTAIGIVMVYSSSAILGITRYQDPNHFLFKQLARAAWGGLALFVCMRLPLRWVERAAPVVLAGAVGLLLTVLVVGHVSNGATRWLRAGMVSLQPTEVARLAMVVFLAWWLKRHPPAELGFVRGLLPSLGILAGLAGLIVLQPNLSSAAMMFGAGFTVVYFAGARLRHLAVPVAAGLAAAVLVVLTHPYMLARVHTYADFLIKGQLDARGAGWQLDQSLIAIGSGGWFGRGIGGGLQKYLFLPEAHTDFIFSILAEEVGFLGATALIVTYGLLVWRGMRAASRATDPFSYLLAAGITLQIGLYAFVNLAVATGLVPTTGLPLPFVSYGGSALLVNLAAAGLLHRVSRSNAADEALTRQRWSRGHA